jgi:molybdenum-dependent DNA-binding transcriptional regulator ModE
LRERGYSRSLLGAANLRCGRLCQRRRAREKALLGADGQSTATARYSCHISSLFALIYAGHQMRLHAATLGWSNKPMAKTNLQLRQLEVFRAVVRTGSVTGASRLLGISQPGVSKILAHAQEACGFTLFERLHGRIVPTARAFALFDETERLFVGMEEIAHLLERLRAEEPRRAVIAATPVLAQELLPHVAARWVGIPGADRLAITTRDAGGVMAMAASRRAEIGLSSVSVKMPGLRSFLIARPRVLCALPPGPPARRAGHHSPAGPGRAALRGPFTP